MTQMQVAFTPKIDAIQSSLMKLEARIEEYDNLRHNSRAF